MFPIASDHAKPRLAAHHLLVGLGDALQRENFVHRTHAVKDAERERVLRIDGRPRIPALHREAPGNQLSTGETVSDGEAPMTMKVPFAGEAALRGRHSVAAGDG